MPSVIVQLQVHTVPKDIHIVPMQYTTQSHSDYKAQVHSARESPHSFASSSMLELSKSYISALGCLNRILGQTRTLQKA
eukprot:1158337-Pelagomonas_calceolata.AAC.3